MDRLSDVLAATAAAWALLWSLAVVAVAAARRPRRARPGATTSELGPASPVVANLVAHRFRSTPEAVPAVVLDLAARRHLEIVELPGGEQHVLHVPAAPAGGQALSPCEAQVLEHLRGVAVRGVVPAPAMTTGPEAASAAWWQRFDRSAVAEAQVTGLCRPVWDGWALGLLAAGPVVAIALAALAALTHEDDRTTPWAMAAVVGVAVPSIVAARIRQRRRQRGTPEGDRAAAEWLGVAAHLAETDRYEQLTPGAVVLDGRHLAYACALGLAPICVERLPLGAEDDGLAWSRWGGRWRPVRVRYPRLAAGWGRHPLVALLVGLALAALGAVPLVQLGTADVAWWVQALAAAVFGPVLLRGLLLVVRGLADLPADEVVEGLVVRARRRQVGSTGNQPKYQHWVALDDGRATKVRAWKVRPRIYAEVAQDRAARVVVTRRLGYVRSATDVAPDGVRRNLSAWPPPAPPPSPR